MNGVTIRDVAKAAEVSISTVSRYLNGSTKIEPLSRMRIEKAIRELEYMPNAAARSLKSQQTHVIGIIVSDIANAFFINVCKALESVISQYGYSLIICSSYEDREREYRSLKMLSERRVDALVVCPSGKNNDLLLSIKKSGTPVIVIDRAFDDLALDRVIENTGSVCRQLTSSLLSKGHRRITFLVGSEQSQTAQVRVSGVRAAYEAAGVSFHEADIRFNCVDEWGAYHATEDAMKKENPPTAVFALNPRMTNGFLMYAARNHVQIPRQLSFIGLTLKNSVTVFPLDITRIEQDPEGVGLKTGDLLIKTLKGDRKSSEKPVSIEFEQNIVAGETVRSIL